MATVAVAERHAVLEGEETVHGLEHQAAVGRKTDECEDEIAAAIGDLHVLLARVGEGVEIPVHAHHHGAREVDELPGLGTGRGANGERWTLELIGERGPLALQRSGLPMDGGLSRTSAGSSPACSAPARE